MIKYFDFIVIQKYQNVIKPGMRGVLVFGADNEAKAKKEAYNLLNEVMYLSCTLNHIVKISCLFSNTFDSFYNFSCSLLIR